MTYTCATEGCGEPIEWREYVHEMRWVHEPWGIIGCRAVYRKLKGSWPDWEHIYAHPAGGTNTTPPEELPVSYHEWGRGFAGPHFICKKCGDSVTVPEGFGPPNKELCPTPPEELERDVTERTYKWTQDELLVEMNRQLAEISTLKAEVADLREQLDRALVPKFKVGDRVTYTPWNVTMTVSGVGVSYTFEGYGKIQHQEEKLLAPLETETPKCQHEENAWKVNEHGFWIGRPARFCSSCGESLTKEDV